MFLLAFSSVMLVFLFGIFVLAIPVVVGVLVYKDAKKRSGCTPWLWALIAALVPSFIGVVIYVLVRNDYPLKPEYMEPWQKVEYERKYGKTPEEESWYQQNYDNQAVETGMPTWGKVLIIIALAVVAVFVIALIVGVVQMVSLGTGNIDAIDSMGI